MKILPLQISIISFCLVWLPFDAGAGVTARYVRVDNPTGFAMEFQEIEVLSHGQNVALNHPERVRATAATDANDKSLTAENFSQIGGRVSRELVDGSKNTKNRAQECRAFVDPATGTLGLDPWFEVDLGREVPIEKIVLYASRYPKRFYLDKGHRAIAVLNEKRQVVWADHWQYLDQKSYPDGIFTFEPSRQTAQDSPVAGMTIKEGAPDWAPMGWLLPSEEGKVPPDAKERMIHFQARNSPAEIERLAHRFFAALDERLPELAEAFKLYKEGKYQAALDAWKVYWFGKMQRINMQVALHEGASYRSNGDDLLNNLMVTITGGEANAIRYVPGEILWLDFDGKSPGALSDDGQVKAQVGVTSWPLLYSFRDKPDPRYIQRWAEIIDDWALNFFTDAAKTGIDLEGLFTYRPAHAWGATMEDLSNIAVAQPSLINIVPSTTLARMQLLCLEKYSTAWWRQTRETVFNHITGGIYAWSLIAPYIQEFHAGQRAAREDQQGFERFMTLGTEPDGSMTEIGDEGHFEIPTILGYTYSLLDATKSPFLTPGWRNRFMGWYDNLFYYMFRHTSPGGYEHRFGVNYRPERWTSTTRYWTQRPVYKVPNRDAAVLGNPEIRRILDAVGFVSAGGPPAMDPVFKPVVEAQERTYESILKMLDSTNPGAPKINSDWMPYTGAYYFRGNWNWDAPFLAMMACGSHGGSQAPQWPYGMFYHYDYFFPLVAAQPVQVDGLPPQQMFGRMNCLAPGTKTMALANADENPAPHRWLSDERFDFGEAVFEGGYQKFAGTKGSGADEVISPGPAVENMRSSRQIFQLRGSRLFIITDAIASQDGATHHYSIPYSLSLSTRTKEPSKAFGPDQLLMDEAKGILRSDNPDGPSATLYQFADQPLKYTLGKPAKPDGKYGRRLGPGFAIADQPVQVSSQGDKLSVVSLLSSRNKDSVEGVASVKAMNGHGSVGFYAKLSDGGEIWYQSAGLGEANLLCGPAQGKGQSLLVVRNARGLSGILLGGKQFSLQGRNFGALQNPDFEFTQERGVTQGTVIYRPIDPVKFEPARNAFLDKETIRMTSKTPNVEIHYTTDGTQPTLKSPLYAGPLTITESAEFAARAWRLGADGKPLPSEEFEVNGTHFSRPSYGWFYKKPLQEAVSVDDSTLKPGLNYDYLSAPWWTLYASAHWLPAAGGGTVAREMDLSKVSTQDYYGMRYKGYVKIPENGVYTFQAPHELSYMDNAPSYDFRLFIDGQEWYLTQWWHGHGTWSIPLQKGFHAFQLDFADARSTPWKKSGIWRHYPKPWAVYQGAPSDLLVSGPGLEKVRIPQDWFYHVPEARTFEDERILADWRDRRNCSWDNKVDAPLQGLREICFEAGGNTNQVFGGLKLVKSDGSQLSFADAARNFLVKMDGDKVFLDLRGDFASLSGSLAPEAGKDARVIARNPFGRK